MRTHSPKAVLPSRWRMKGVRRNPTTMVVARPNQLPTTFLMVLTNTSDPAYLDRERSRRRATVRMLKRVGGSHAEQSIASTPETSKFMNNARVLVTGSCGLIGSEVCVHFHQAG